MLTNETEAQAFVRQRCSGESLAALVEFSAMLREANAAQNLVSKTTLDQVWLRHIADSAQLLDHVAEKDCGRGFVPRETSWVDFGTGAGFPGMIVAIMRPEYEVSLIESRNLRIAWLEHAIAKLSLSNCYVIGRDVQKVETFEAGVISARAFAPLPRLIQLCARFSTNATQWVLPKGRSAEQDISKLPKCLRARFHVKQSATDPDAGIVVARGAIQGFSA